MPVGEVSQDSRTAGDNAYLFYCAPLTFVVHFLTHRTPNSTEITVIQLLKQRC
jgi:hypothetical protein